MALWRGSALSGMRSCQELYRLAPTPDLISKFTSDSGASTRQRSMADGCTDSMDREGPSVAFPVVTR